MGNDESASDESFADDLLEYPQYTRPADFRGWSVPQILRSGDHGRIARWRRAQAIARTVAERPDLVERRGGLSDEEKQLVEEIGALEQNGPEGYPDESPPGQRPQDSESSAP
jgi:tRNA (guanine37-N1)-methyltransferase